MSVAAAAIENAASLARELADLPASPRGGGAAPAAAASSEEDSLQRCLVYCRLRPSKKQDYEDGAYKLISMTPKSVILKDERNYDVDGTFDEDSRQEDIFERVASST